MRSATLAKPRRSYKRPTFSFDNNKTGSQAADTLARHHPGFRPSPLRPMLHIHFSNRYEVLTSQLPDQLDRQGRIPFVADEVIVPSTAVQRSLTLAMAQARGICANVAFSYLAPWLWRQMSRLL
jgi:hypothetical protein